tara:strand:- start:21 stop:203 length:183 start_codon:yes stop_codon:yes gene_type:complete
MTYTYKLIKNPMTNTVDCVRQSSDTDNIVKIIRIEESSDDSDYLEYKDWLADGNTPEAAD